MQAKLRLFFLGSLGIVVLAMGFLIYRGSQDENSDLNLISHYPQPTPELNVEKPANTNITPESKAQKENDPVKEKITVSPPLPQKPKEKLGDWIAPNEITYLDQSPRQKMILEELRVVGEYKIVEPANPEFIGTNDQGFDQYTYTTAFGEKVSQWKRSGEISVEEIVMENGDKIVRRAPENERPYTEVSYDNKADGSSKSVYYRNNGTVESIRVEQNKVTTIYYYDEQGRLTDTYTYSEK